MESTYFNLNSSQTEKTKYESENNGNKRCGKEKLERISTSFPSGKTSEQLKEEIIISDKIKKWEKKSQVIGDILKVYYRWKRKIQ